MNSHFSARLLQALSGKSSASVNAGASSGLNTTDVEREGPLMQYMYRLIVGQLMYDGLREDAIDLATSVGLTDPICGPSNELSRAFNAYLDGRAAETPSEEDFKRPSQLNVPQNDNPSDDSSILAMGEQQRRTFVPVHNDIPEYKPHLAYRHSEACGAAVFSANGLLMASAGVDGRVIVHDIDAVVNDVRRMQNQNTEEPSRDGRNYGLPSKLFCYFQEQAVEVTALAFHPDTSTGILLTGGVDHSVRTFRLNDCVPNVMLNSSSVYYDSHYIRHLEFHPSGVHCVIATEHPVIRWLNVETNAVSTSAHHHVKTGHSMPITSISYEKDGTFFASSSKDGSLRVWDGRTLDAVHALEHAHGQFEINSVTVSRDGKRMLSNSNNSSVMLWAVGYPTERGPVLDYTLQTASQYVQAVRTQAVFDCDEKLVMLPVPAVQQQRLLVWDSSTAHFFGIVPLLHSSFVKRICSNSAMPAYATSSEDGGVVFCAKITD